MQVNVYAIVLLICGLTNLALIPLVWQRKLMPGAKWFALLLLAVGEWCLTYAIEIIAYPPVAKLFWVKIEYFGIVSLAPLWLMFTLTYVHKDGWFVGWRQLLIWIIPGLAILLVYTNNYHHLHYISVGFSGNSSGNQLVLEHGPAFYFFTAYSYILLLIGSIALLWAIINFPQIYRKQTTTLIIGALIPWAINVVYILGLTSGYDPTPFGFSISVFLFFWAIFRLKLFNVIPIARDMVIESMSDGMFVLDSQDHIADMNPAAARIIGIDNLYKAIGRPAGDVLSDFPRLVERYGRVFTTRDEVRLNSPYVDGFFELEINPVTTHQGTLAGRVILLRNITKRRAIDEALKQSERLYHTLIETLPLAIFRKNKDGVYIYVNQLFADNEGIPVEDIIGKSDAEIHSEELASIYVKTDEDVYRKGTHLEFDEEQLLPNGKRIPVHVIKTPLKDTNGDLIGIQGVYWDTTQVRRATLEAQDRLDELTTIYTISQAVTQLDMESLLNVVGEKIVRTFDVQSAYIALFDKKSSMINFPYMVNKGKKINVPSIEFGKGLTSEVIRIREPLVLNSNVEKRNLELGGTGAVASDLGYPRSWLGVPMIVGDDVIGVMSAQDFDRENVFSDPDVKLFSTIASNIGIAFNNAHLYREVQEELSERKQAEEALADSQERLQAIFDNAGAGIGVTWENAEIIFVNDRWTELFGYTTRELAGLTLWDLCHGEEKQAVHDNFELMLTGKLDRFQKESRFINKNGSEFWGTASAKAIRRPDNSLENVIIIVSDITLIKTTEAELIKVNQQLVTQLEEIAILRDRLREQAIRDPLTNLYNRRFMEETLALEIHRARRSDSKVSLIMMDIDHFKSVNDQFGHKAGDHVLESLGQMLLANTRKSDVACRYGGEEFLIVLPGSSIEDAARRAEQFRASFEAIPIMGKNTVTHATMSIGVASFPMHGTDGEQVLNRADEALYEAKAAGRNCVVVYKTKE